MSCTCQSNGASATITPVSPPRVNTKKKPNTYSIGTVSRGRAGHRVAIQVKTWMPVGIATAMLAAEKNASASWGMPTAYMWCTHRPKLRKPTATRAITTAV